MNFALVLETILSLLIFVIPLGFLTLTAEFYETSKMLILLIVVPLATLVWILDINKNRKISLCVNPLNFPVILLTLAFIAATVFSSPNKVESLVSSQGLALMLILTLYFFTLVNSIKKKDNLVYALIISSTVLSFLYILQFFGLVSLVTPFDFMKNDSWTPTGGLLYTAMILIATIPLALEIIFKDHGTEPNLKKTLLWTSTLLMGAAVALASIKLTTTAKPVLLPQQAGWSVGVEVLKNFKTAFFGVGPGQFLTAYTQNKPLGINSTPFWSIPFSRSSSFVLNLLTEVGLLGLLALFLTISKVVRESKRRIPHGVRLSLLILFLSLCFFPLNVTVLFVLFTMLAFFALENKTREATEVTSILPKVFLIMTLVAASTFYYLGWRWYRAETLLLQSLVARNRGEGIQTYNLQVKTVNTNPSIDLYHVALSQTNIDLAAAIVKQKGENLSDQDRSDILNLIQQAIREAKTAVDLNPRKVSNWENLALIYRNLINATQGSDQWAVASYRQAVALDPLNPSLRIGFGGLLFELKNIDEAINQFATAVNLKPDLANSHYNLSNAYKTKEDYENAFVEMQNTLALVNPNSSDFNTASAELEELRAKLPKKPQEQKAEGEETLSSPQESELNVEPKLELSEEQAPPESSASPSASPTE